MKIQKFAQFVWSFPNFFLLRSAQAISESAGIQIGDFAHHQLGPLASRARREGVDSKAGGLRRLRVSAEHLFVPNRPFKLFPRPVRSFCGKINIKPLSTADFGKVMKQVFPDIRPRRLGTRGHSRYCYAAMRKAMKLQPPHLPDLATQSSSLTTADEGDEVTWKVIKGWSESLLSAQFDSADDLAAHISHNKLNSPSGSTSKQLLQKKLMQREMKERRRNNVSDDGILGGNSFFNFKSFSESIAEEAPQEAPEVDDVARHRAVQRRHVRQAPSDKAGEGDGRQRDGEQFLGGLVRRAADEPNQLGAVAACPKRDEPELESVGGVQSVWLRVEWFD